ncbi:PREDICTED: putative receptor kinase ZmPK1 [Prunus dulcis]|uniref:Receptor-like serine/threonine-protein kinase n=1 Tax=Prunus dulcis TaxID=3755 RepID=A0A5E4FI90_PRUDU|nr:putative receptor protein kinase ZmPK1 [Prunus dulcis]VVA25358.1 PREDICTED: putative receptor kinase ZmPK1 [Prunus dulcis]
MEVLKFLLLLLFAATVDWSEAGLSSLRQGSSLKVEEEIDFLVSLNRTFSSGFYKVGTNASCYSIWFTNSVNKTVVWMANRDKPVSGRGSKLTLHRNGNLVLTDGVGSIVWSTNTFSDASVEARLLETGNLVLINQAKEVLWQSFDSPTDTLLPSQKLVRNTTLVSMRSQGTYLSGFYNFKFGDSNVLYLVYNGPQFSSAYWPKTDGTVFDIGRTPYNSSRLAILDEAGQFISSDNLMFNASDYGIGPKRRLTMDYDGILRLYSLDESTGLWEMSWVPDGVDACLVHGLCGAYGICTYKPQPTCSCPYGFSLNDPSDRSKGCSASFDLSNDATKSDFLLLPNTDYYGYDLDTYALGISFSACRNECLTDSRCKGFGYALDGKGQCFPKSFLLNGFHMPNTLQIMHVKIPKGFLSKDEVIKKLETYDLNCSAAQVSLKTSNLEVEKSNKNRYMDYLVGFLSSFAIIETICIGLTWWYAFRKHAHEEFVNMGYIALAMGFKRFTYAELKRATDGFKQEVGKGGFGTVYKGVLDDERVVAVKRLDGILQGDAEFWAEVSVIGNINHRNLVKLWGFCADNEHKLLVYEYLENGSLDKILFTSDGELGLEQRYNIALGTAKGLSYLHEECLEWVLHCDVKPQNILLDDHLEPKVSDFGMSKLFKDIQGIRDINGMGFSKARGTRGYMAPEWMMNLKIDAKADVYSYGIVLLELLSGKSASILISALAKEYNECNQLAQCVTEKIRKEGLEEVLDPRLLGELDKKKLERLMKVALLCVQDDRSARPAMSKVVELLLENDQ